MRNAMNWEDQYIYEQLQKSCDFGCTKKEGLFEFLINRMNLMPNKCQTTTFNKY